MFHFRKQRTEPDKAIVGLTQFDENRMNAIVTVTFRYDIRLIDADYVFFELEKREVLTEAQLTQDFDVIINALYKKYETDFLSHRTNLRKIAGYNDRVIVIV